MKIEIDNIADRNKEKKRIYDKQYHQIYGKIHKEELTIKARKNQQSYKLKWIEFFKKRYEEKPRCQMCNKELKWKGKKAEIVHFDHRNGGKVFIKCPPSTWIQGRPCTLNHQKTWNECNFGILCHGCNKQLPTLNRKQWLQDAIKYVNGGK